MKKQQKLFIGIGAAVAIAMAGTYLILKSRKAKEDQPPKKAPQIDLENPGEQSEFITAASPSEMG